MRCNKDCFNCTYDDCINDYIAPSSWQTISDEQRSRYRITGNMRHRQLYKERKEKGLCVRCGIRKATNGIYCLDCYVKRCKQRQKEKVYINKHEEWKEKGLCYFCGEACIEGHLVCKRHYEIGLMSIKKCHNSNAYKKSRKEFERKIYGCDCGERVMNNGL